MTHIRRPVVLDDPATEPPPKKERRYPGMDVSTAIVAVRTDGSGTGGCWCLEDNAEAVWARLRKLMPNATVIASYSVQLRYSGMTIRVQGQPDELWPVVRARAEALLDEVIAAHNRLHPVAYQIAATHAEYATGMHGGYS